MVSNEYRIINQGCTVRFVLVLKFPSINHARNQGEVALGARVTVPTSLAEQNLSFLNFQLNWARAASNLWFIG